MWGNRKDMNGQNATESLLVYRRNHGLRRVPCTVKTVRNVIRNFGDIG